MSDDHKDDSFGEIENARLLARDKMLYGTTFTDVIGKRIDPVQFGYPAVPRSRAFEELTGPLGKVGPLLPRVDP